MFANWGWTEARDTVLIGKVLKKVIKVMSLFFVAFVPLRLVDEANNRNVWSNSRTSSTLFCGPIKFIFAKENTDLTRGGEENKINKAVSELIAYNTSYADKNLNMSFELLFTMLDSSVANILSGTNATSKCFVCGAIPKETNTDNVVNKPHSSQNYRFGLSILHCWIRFFEYLLHRLPF